MDTPRGPFRWMLASFVCAAVVLYALAAAFATTRDLRGASQPMAPEASQSEVPSAVPFIRSGHLGMTWLRLVSLLRAKTTDLVFEAVAEDGAAPGSLWSAGAYAPLVVRVTKVHRGDLRSYARFTLRLFEGQLGKPQLSRAKLVHVLEPAQGKKLLVLAAWPRRMRGTPPVLQPHAVYVMDEFELRELTPRAWHGERVPMTPTARMEKLLRSALEVKEPQAGHVTPKRRIGGGSGYQVQFTFEEYLDFPATGLVFEGVVEEVMPARLVRGDFFTHVYSPVVLRVTSMHRGEMPEGGRIVLRAFGGIAEEVEFVSSLDAPDEVKTVGRKLLVMADQLLRVAGDTLKATTPGAVYMRVGDTLHNITYVGSERGRGSVVPLEEAEELLGAEVL